MDLAEEAVEVLDLVDDARGQREVDRVGAEEGKIRGVALVPLDANFSRVGEAPPERELRRRDVDCDDVRAEACHRDRVLSRATPEVEDTTAGYVATQAQVGLGRQVGPVLHDVGGGGFPPTRRDPIPRLDVRHARESCRSWHRAASATGLLVRELLDHPMGLVVVVLDRRRLHEVRRRSE